MIEIRRKRQEAAEMYPIELKEGRVPYLYFPLLDRTGLLCTPGSAFGSLGEGYVRFALVQPVPVMEQIIAAVAGSGILNR